MRLPPLAGRGDQSLHLARVQLDHVGHVFVRPLVLQPLGRAAVRQGERGQPLGDRALVPRLADCRRKQRREFRRDVVFLPLFLLQPCHRRHDRARPTAGLPAAGLPADVRRQVEHGRDAARSQHGRHIIRLHFDAVLR